MRILQVANDYQQSGGESEAVLDICQLLKEERQEVFEYKRTNNEIKTHSLLDNIAFPVNTIFSIKSFLEIRKLLRNNHIDVMHVHNIMPLISGSSLYAATSSKIPIIQHLHNYRLFCVNGLMLCHGLLCDTCLKGNYLCAIRDKCYRDSRLMSTIYAGAIAFHIGFGIYKKVDHFIAISEFVKQVYVRYGIPDKKLTVLHNFISSSRTKNTTNNQVYIIYVGRLSPEKGLLTFLRSITLLKSKVRVVLIGDGPQRNILESYVKDHFMEVEFLGHLPKEKTLEVISAARVLVLPSECYEGFGRVIVEAYACSVPVVASNIGGIPEIVKDGVTGKLFIPTNFSDLAEKLEWILSLPDKQFVDMKKHVYEIASTKFDKKTYYQNLMNIYDLVRHNK